jgi:hypothetical protein
VVCSTVLVKYSAMKSKDRKSQLSEVNDSKKPSVSTSDKAVYMLGYDW